MGTPRLSNNQVAMRAEERRDFLLCKCKRVDVAQDYILNTFDPSIRPDHAAFVKTRQVYFFSQLTPV